VTEKLNLVFVCEVDDSDRLPMRIITGSDRN